MPWLIGIDEAGYGPNLGPLVQASIPLLVRDRDIDPWKLLASHCRRANEINDDRLLIDDSKKVHVGVHGFQRLERGVLSLLAETVPCPVTLGDLLRRVATDESRLDLLGEAWFDVTWPLPKEAPADALRASGKSFQNGLTQNALKLGAIIGVVTPAPRFNALLDRWNNKAGVLAAGVIQLLQRNRALPGKEPLIYLIDKLGGRHYYAAMIQEAFPDGWVIAEREGPEICSYRIIGTDREIRLMIQPRADNTHFAVALASMTAKYLREVFMKQFNSYWQAHVPAIKPTAGYPTDAARFMEEIRATVAALGFSIDAIWRRK